MLEYGTEVKPLKALCKSKNFASVSTDPIPCKSFNKQKNLWHGWCNMALGEACCAGHFSFGTVLKWTGWTMDANNMGGWPPWWPIVAPQSVVAVARHRQSCPPNLQQHNQCAAIYHYCCQNVCTAMHDKSSHVFGVDCWLAQKHIWHLFWTETMLAVFAAMLVRSLTAIIL